MTPQVNLNVMYLEMIQTGQDADHDALVQLALKVAAEAVEDRVADDLKFFFLVASVVDKIGPEI